MSSLTKRIFETAACMQPMDERKNTVRISSIITTCNITASNAIELAVS